MSDAKTCGICPICNELYGITCECCHVAICEDCAPEDENGVHLCDECWRDVQDAKHEDAVERAGLW